jgi:heme-degrading monooxygenase HmoA
MAAAMVTLISIFTVAPERQDDLVRLLQAMIDEVARTLPGFISATVHRGVDGKQVANYARWESVEAWKAMVRHPDIQARMTPILAVATFQSQLYEVVSAHAPPGAS